MRRAVAVVIALGLALALSLGAVQAQGVYPLDPQAWAGGNGWCEGGVCFRAWATAAGVEVRWLVASSESLRLTLLRRELQPATREPQPLAESDCLADSCPAEFSYSDTLVVPGAIYQYMLVESDSGVELGEPLEAGLAAAATDPGGSSPHRVFLPLTLSQGR